MLKLLQTPMTSPDLDASIAAVGGLFCSALGMQMLVGGHRVGFAIALIGVVNLLHAWRFLRDKRGHRFDSRCGYDRHSSDGAAS